MPNDSWGEVHGQIAQPKIMMESLDPVVGLEKMALLEEARRENCFRDLIGKFPKLSFSQMKAIQAAMESGPSRMWSVFDGKTVKVRRVDIAEGKISIVFDVTVPAVNLPTVTEDEFDVDRDAKIPDRTYEVIEIIIV